MQLSPYRNWRAIRLRVANARLLFRVPMYFRNVSSQNSILYSLRVSSYW
jgi:hypothetical protein